MRSLSDKSWNSPDGAKRDIGSQFYQNQTWFRKCSVQPFHILRRKKDEHRNELFELLRWIPPKHEKGLWLGSGEGSPGKMTQLKFTIITSAQSSIACKVPQLVVRASPTRLPHLSPDLRRRRFLTGLIHIENMPYIEFNPDHNQRSAITWRIGWTETRQWGPSLVNVSPFV